MRIVLQLLAVTAVLAGASGAASAQAPTTVPTTVPATQPTRVTVDIPGLPLVEAAEEFSRQTGIPLHFGDPKGGDIEVDIALKDVPVLASARSSSFFSGRMRLRASRKSSTARPDQTESRERAGGSHSCAAAAFRPARTASPAGPGVIWSSFCAAVSMSNR